MNRFFKVAATVCGVMFAAALLISFRTIASSPYTAQERASPDSVQYAFSIYMPDKDYPYYNKIRQGVSDKARELDCAVTFHSLSEDSIELKAASLSGVDGAAYYPQGEQACILDQIESFLNSSLPLVLIEHLLPTDPALYLVGTNSYDVGRKIGELVSGCKHQSHHIAFIYSEKNPGLMADRQALELGFRLALEGQEYSVVSRETNSNPLDAESEVDELLRENPDINLIILTDSNDTMAALQVIIDRNLVGKVEIIGFGDDFTIQDYIKKGVLRGTVVPNSYQIGSRVVQTLYEVARTGSSSAIVDIEAGILTRESIRAK